MISWAPWEGVASRLVTRPPQHSGADLRARFAVRRHPMAFCVEIGELRVVSAAGAGTTVTARLPCVS